MKKFQFPLHAVLTLRRMKQEQALEAYAQAVQECVQKRNEVLSATRRADDLTLLLTQPEGQTFSARMQQAYLSALDAARTEVKQLEQALTRAEQQKDAQLKEFLDRKRKAEVLEHLREQQKHNHLREEYRKEELEIEDLVMSKRAVGI
jgi:flagellar export protein FliJ